MYRLILWKDYTAESFYYSLFMSELLNHNVYNMCLHTIMWRDSVTVQEEMQESLHEQGYNLQICASVLRALLFSSFPNHHRSEPTLLALVLVCSFYCTPHIALFPIYP